jgi:hypothetical protein
MTVGEVGLSSGRQVSGIVRAMAWIALGLSVFSVLLLVYFKIQEAGTLRDEALAYMGYSQFGWLDGNAIEKWISMVAWPVAAVLWVVSAFQTGGFARPNARWPVLAAGIVALIGLFFRVLAHPTFSISVSGQSLSYALRDTLFPPSFGSWIRPDMYNNELWLYVGVLLPVAVVISVVAAVWWFVSTRTPRSEYASSDEVNVMPGQGVSGTVPSGWYPDPDGKPADRYWDGDAWTEQTRPATAPRPAATVTRVAAGPGYNVLAIIAFVSAFVVPLVLPIVLGYIALGQIKRTSEGGRGLALAAVILGWIFTVFFVLYVAVVVLAVSSST